jgi:hypothetical protein
VGERDYFGYDETPRPQSMKVGSPKPTPWARYPSFFQIKGIILTEKPEAPQQLAEGFEKVRERFALAADQLDDRARELSHDWSVGASSQRYFWFAGGTLYGLDEWVKQLGERVTSLTLLAADISEAHQAAEDLEDEFEQAYFQKAPPGAAFYGFPPDTALNNPAIPDDVEQELKDRVNAVYADVHAHFRKRIIELGTRLAKAFVQAANWVGASAGKVPLAAPGPDAATPWRPYTPGALTPVRPSVAVPLLDDLPVPSSVTDSPYAFVVNGPGTPSPLTSARPGDPMSTTSMPSLPPPDRLSPAGHDGSTAADGGAATPALPGRLVAVPVGPPAGVFGPRTGAESGRARWGSALETLRDQRGLLAGRFAEAGRSVPELEPTLGARGPFDATPIGDPLPPGAVGRTADTVGTPGSAAVAMHQLLAGRAAATQAIDGDPSKTASGSRSGALGGHRSTVRAPTTPADPAGTETRATAPAQHISGSAPVTWPTTG